MTLHHCLVSKICTRIALPFLKLLLKLRNHLTTFLWPKLHLFILSSKILSVPRLLARRELERSIIISFPVHFPIKVPILKEAIENIHAVSAILESKRATLSHEVNEAFDQLVKLVEARRAQVLAELSATEIKKQETLGETLFQSTQLMIALCDITGLLFNSSISPPLILEAYYDMLESVE